MDKMIYVIRDKFDLETYHYTLHKSVLKGFLKYRDPDRYEWVKITEEKDIERTKNLLRDYQLHKYGDIALTQTEYESFQDHMMVLQPYIMNEIESLVKSLKFVKLTDEETRDIVVMLKTVYDFLNTIEEPPPHLDGVIDETDLFNEYRLAKKYLIEDCL